jgi:hypothetical protein
MRVVCDGVDEAMTAGQELALLFMAPASVRRWRAVDVDRYFPVAPVSRCDGMGTGEIEDQGEKIARLSPVGGHAAGSGAIGVGLLWSI